MEQEIDLRQYIRVLIRHWYWIAGLGLTAAVVAFLVSSFLPPTYEASALVAIAEPGYQLQFDSRLRDVPFDPRLLSKSYPTIATSDDLLLNVADAAGDLLPAGHTGLNGIKRMLDAKPAADPYLVQLTVRSEDPQLAAALVNVWAVQYISYLNILYGEIDSLAAFEAQLAEAKAAVAQADEALAAFRREYGIGFAMGEGAGLRAVDVGILRRLEVKAELLLTFEVEAQEVSRLLQEAQAVAAQTDAATSPAVVSGLMADMLNLGFYERGSTPLLQISLADLDPEAAIAAMIDALEAKKTALDEAVSLLETEVQSLQAEVAGRQEELDQLLRDQKVADATYLALSAKVQEVRIQGQGNVGDVARIVSRAAVPEAAVGPRRLFNTVIAGVLGMIVGACAALFSEYWRQGASQLPSGGQEPS